MGELIVKQEDLYVIKPDVADAMIKYKQAADYANGLLDDLKDMLLEEMKKKNVIKVDAENKDAKLVINYIAATTSETFNKKRFRKDHPDMYDEYIEITPKKESLRLTLK